MDINSITFKPVDSKVGTSDVIFNCENNSIDESIKLSYFATLAKQHSSFYIMAGDVTIGFFAYHFYNISCDSIPSSDEARIETSICDNIYGSIHIEYFAIDGKFQKKRFGTVALFLICNKLKKIIEPLPIRYITLESLSSVVSFYKNFGFEEATQSPNSNNNILMYHDCIPEDNLRELQKYME